MKRYRMTNKRDLRRAFWNYCLELGGEYAEEASKKRHSFKLDFNILFGEYTDMLCKNGEISLKLYENTCLY